LAYFLFWFFVGLILGPCVLGIVMLYVFETNKIYLAHAIEWTFRWTSYDKFALVFIIVISLLVMFLSFNFLFDLLKKIGQFPKTVIDPIMNHYQSNFPSLMVKTNLKEFKSQLKDFQNKFFVTLYEGNVLHLISWDQIETMGAIDINKSKCTVNNEPKKKNLLMYDSLLVF
jgi:MFS family permease